MNKTLSSKSMIDIQARKWFDKVNGNTYHTVKIFIENNGENDTLKTKGIVYGYGNHYQQTACEMLNKAGYKINAQTVKKVNAAAGYEVLKDTSFRYGCFYGLHRYARMLDYSVTDNCTKRDALALVK